jgi:putative FmdB family regulatory protein
MPTYAYRCMSCQYEFEVEARMQDAAPQQGPRCTGPDCRIQKLMKPVMGWVKGSSPAPAPAKASSPAEAPRFAAEDPVHLCSKYCDLHKA